jgi:hypothetical protein
MRFHLPHLGPDNFLQTGRQGVERLVDRYAPAILLASLIPDAHLRPFIVDEDLDPAIIVSIQTQAALDDQWLYKRIMVIIPEFAVPGPEPDTCLVRGPGDEIVALPSLYKCSLFLPEIDGPDIIMKRVIRGAN